MSVRKRVLVVILAVLSPWLFYLLAANLLIATPLLSWLASRHPDRLQLDYRFAYTLWPARVHVSGFHLQYRSPKVGFELEIDEASTDVVLRELAKRKFHATHVRASGVAYRMIDNGHPLDARTAAFPVIPGITPLEVPHQQLPRDPSTLKKLWTVELTDTEAAVKELWVLEYRWRGHGRASGSFALQPMQHVWVGPCVLDLAPGVLTAGDHAISTDLGLHGVFTMFDVDIPQERRAIMLRAISGRVALDATLQHLDVAQLYGVKARGTGRLAADVMMDHGRFMSGSQVGLALDDLTGHAKGYGYDGSVSVSAWVEGGRPHVRAAATGAAHVPLPNDETLTVETRRAQADVSFSTTDISEAWRLPWVRASAAELVARDARPFVASFRKRMPFIVPPLLGEGPLIVEQAAIEGSPDDLEVHIGAARLGDVRLTAEAEVGPGKPADAYVDGHLSAIPFHLKVEDGKSRLRLFGRRRPSD